MTKCFIEEANGRMNEEFVELKLQFLKGHVEIRESKDPDFPDGKYMTYSRLIKKVADKLYLEIVLSNKNPNLRCHKCKRRVPIFFPYGYVYKEISCSEVESLIICLDCMSKSRDEELAYFIMNYGQDYIMDYGQGDIANCENCPEKKDPDTCPIRQKWNKIGEEIAQKIQVYYEEREKRRSG